MCALKFKSCQSLCLGAFPDQRALTLTCARVRVYIASLANDLYFN